MTQTNRYERQMLLPNLGLEQQQRLTESTVLLLGCGALGCVIADMLARAGVGHLIIVDRDVVEISNLQRQVLFTEKDAAESLPKSAAAKRRLQEINSEIAVTAIIDDIHAGNIEKFAQEADLLIDGLDNFETRYLANDIAVKSRKPYIYGAAVGVSGMSFPILPHGDAPRDWDQANNNLSTPCFRCLFTEAPLPGTTATCDTAGVLNSLIGLVANLQVTEALKILTGNYAAVRRRLLTVDVWNNEFDQLNVSSRHTNNQCPCCKQRKFEYLDATLGSRTTELCGRNAVQLRHQQTPQNIDLDALSKRLEQQGHVTLNDFVLRAAIDDFEFMLFKDGRTIIKGTDNAATARSIYAKYIGM